MKITSTNNYNLNQRTNFRGLETASSEASKHMMKKFMLLTGQIGNHTGVLSYPVIRLPKDCLEKLRQTVSENLEKYPKYTDEEILDIIR